MTARTADQRLFLGVVVTLVGLAWAILWLWGQSPYGRFLDHEELGTPRLGPDRLVAFGAGWTLMIGAMMLPTSLPFVAAFRTLVRQRPDRTRLLAALITVYLGLWSLFGLLLHLGDWKLHQIVASHSALWPYTWMLGTAPLILAGLYQFTPLKGYCLTKCRSPLSFIAAHWQGRRPAADAFWLGVHHGLFCLGCCWSLMLLMFAVGVGNLGWMLLLSAAMLVEKTVPWGRRLTAPLGVLLIGWGLLLALGHLLVVVGSSS